MTLPLEGLRVLDLSRLIPGPFATKLLQDMGAQVDKLEDPRVGDYLRSSPPLGPWGVNPAFELLNRGKRSFTLDLKSEEGRSTFERLLPGYDVLVESFRPGVMARLGLGPERLRKAFPSLVICSISGYGQTGPLNKRAAHDLGYLARSGALALSGPAQGPPQTPGIQLADTGSALYAVIGILAALRGRDAGGEGTWLDIAMNESATSFAAFGLASHSAGVDVARGEDVLTGGFAVYQCYETKDGKHVALASLEPKFWRAFCEGTGFEGPANALEMGPHQGTLRAKLAALFRTRDRDAWAEFGGQYDCCLEPVLEPVELLSDVHQKARGLFLGGLSYLDTPCARSNRDTAPAHGEHTTDILAEAPL